MGRCPVTSWSADPSRGHCGCSSNEGLWGLRPSMLLDKEEGFGAWQLSFLGREEARQPKMVKLLLSPPSTTPSTACLDQERPRLDASANPAWTVNALKIYPRMKKVLCEWSLTFACSRAPRKTTVRDGQHLPRDVTGLFSLGGRCPSVCVWLERGFNPRVIAVAYTAMTKPLFRTEKTTITLVKASTPPSPCRTFSDSIRRPFSWPS
ncbi:hypothetical protein AOLI_G00260430 [Acnodon oligacanthus]